MEALVALISARNSIARLTSGKTLEVIAAIATGALLGLAAVVEGPLLVLAGMVGLAMFAAAFACPEVVILALLCLVSGLVPSRFNPYLRIASVGLFASDLVLVPLIGAAVFRLLAERGLRFRKTPLDMPMLLFGAAVLVGMGTAVANHGIRFKDTTWEARILLYYLIFFAVTNLVRSKAQLLRLVRGILLIGTLIAGMLGVQAMLGRSVLLMDASTLKGGQLIRFYHPGTTTVFAGLMAFVCLMAVPEDRRRRLLPLVCVPVLGFGLVLTLDRNLIVSSAVSLGVLALLLRSRQMSRLAANLVVLAGALVGILCVLTMLGAEPRFVAYFSALSGRMSNALSGSILSQQENLVPRWREIQFAWAQLVQNPIFGIGLETSYRPVFYWGDTLTSYIHNSYLWIWLKTGLGGLMAFLWFSIAFLARGFRHWRGVEDGLLRAAALGFTLAYLAMMISSLVAPFLTQNWSLAVFGVMLGTNESLFALSEESRGAREGSSSHDKRSSSR
jgi:O-antigen ligase